MFKVMAMPTCTIFSLENRPKKTLLFIYYEVDYLGLLIRQLFNENSFFIFLLNVVIFYVGTIRPLPVQPFVAGDSRYLAFGTVSSAKD